MTELDDQSRATSHAPDNDLDSAAVRRDHPKLLSRPGDGRPLLPALVAVAVAGVIGVVAYLAWPSGGTDANQPAGDETVVKGGPPPLVFDGMAETPAASTRGVTVAITLEFDEDRVITDGQLVMTDGTPDQAVDFYVEDGKDSDGEYVVPLEVAAGVTVDVSTTVLPACGVAVTEAPAFDIRSTAASGGESMDGAAAGELTAWQQAVQEWCDSGVQAHLSGYRTTLDGGVTQTLTIYNPGPDPVTVVCPAQGSADSGWDEAQVTVEGGGVAELKVHADNVNPDIGPALTANGAPLAVISD